MAREVPGFGGVFFDEDGKLNVYMAPVEGQVMAAAEVASILSGRLERLGIQAATRSEMIVHEGRYDFAQLHAWHQRINPVLALPGVVVTDIDESQNRLRIGVEEGTPVAMIERAVAAQGVPGEAVTVFETDPVELVQAPTLTLRDRVRPVAGGLQIVWPIPDVGWFLCTLGFNLRAPTIDVVRGEDFFLTNSHCTAERGTVLGTPYYQPLPEIFGGPEDALIGVEVYDPPFFTGGPCPEERNCRYSDAAGAHYRIPRSQVAFGRIMQPIPGTMLLPSPTSHLRITGELSFPTMGQILAKVGRTTGFTAGTVVLTCAT
ncbi:MAG TPA: hypothetical protein VGR27_02935, partial [Longimicrobiaceae bacterium]|nr:hypothetical protein [Longimicrobiaceae bacterium]